MAKAAAEPPDQRHTEPQQAVRDGSGIHDVGGHDEQRHGKQDEALVQPVHQHLAGHADAVAADSQIDERGDKDGIGYRDADGRQPEQGAEAKKEFQAHSSTRFSGCGCGSSTPWRTAFQTAQP